MRYLGVGRHSICNSVLNDRKCMWGGEKIIMQLKKINWQIWENGIFVSFFHLSCKF